MYLFAACPKTHVDLGGTLGWTRGRLIATFCFEHPARCSHERVGFIDVRGEISPRSRPYFLKKVEKLRELLGYVVLIIS